MWDKKAVVAQRDMPDYCQVMDYVPDLGVAASIGIISWFFARLFNRWWQPSRRRKAIWRMDIGRESQPKLIIDSVGGETTTDYTRPSTGLGAAISATLIVNSLNAAQAALLRPYRLRREEPIEVFLASDEMATNACSTCDTVVIGGPKNNKFAAEYLFKAGCQRSENPAAATLSCNQGSSKLGIATEDNTIWWFGKDFRGNVVSDDHRRLSHFNGTDYGVIIRSNSHLSTGTLPTRIVILFGSQTFGVIGASRYLTEAMDLRKSESKREQMLYRDLRKHPNVAILVSTEVQAGRVLQSNLVDYRVLSDDAGRRDFETH